MSWLELSPWTPETANSETKGYLRINLLILLHQNIQFPASYAFYRPSTQALLPWPQHPTSFSPLREFSKLTTRILQSSCLAGEYASKLTCDIRGCKEWWERRDMEIRNSVIQSGVYVTDACICSGPFVFWQCLPREREISHMRDWFIIFYWPPLKTSEEARHGYVNAFNHGVQEVEASKFL